MKSKSQFYDPDSKYENSIPPKSTPGPNDIMVCDDCINIILQKMKGNKYACPRCLRIYDPQWEVMQYQEQEGLLDDPLRKGLLTFVDDDIKLKETPRQKEPEYVKKEFDHLLKSRPGAYKVDIDSSLFS